MRFDSLVILSLLTACSSPEPTPTLHPTTAAKPDIAPIACTGGDVIFQIDRMSIEHRPDERIASLSIRSSGEWSYDVLAGDKLVRKQHGCLAAPALADLRVHLDEAPWQTTKPDAVCEIAIIVRTEYRVGGRHVFTAQGCASDLLDAKSKAALAAALAIVKPLAPLG